MQRTMNIRLALLLVLSLSVVSCHSSKPRVPVDAAESPMVKYQYELQAIVKVDGKIVRLPKPMYFTDFYMGAWNEYDLSRHPNLDLGTKLFYVPNQHPGPYYIGPYSSEKHNAFTGTDDERSFLTYEAREKGMVFTGIWNEYAESIIMEPANNVGTPPDEHAAWKDSRPVFLDNFTAAKIPVTQPVELMTESR